MKKILGIVLSFILLVTMVGCGSKNDSSSASNSNGEPSISIDDIDWKVKEGIIDSKRFVLLELTNNTKYTITKFDINFTEKKGLKDEDKENYYSELKKDFGWSDDDINSLKEKDIAFSGKSERIIDSEKSVKNQRLYYYTGYYYLTSIEHYKLSEPDNATISFIDDNKIYTVSYDFHSKEYTYDENTETAVYWTKKVLKDKAPKPNSKVVKENGRDDDQVFMFEAYGMTKEEFEKYIDECKKQGYTNDEKSFDGFYSADDKDGYNVYLSYDEDDFKMSAIISAPDKTE